MIEDIVRSIDKRLEIIELKLSKNNYTKQYNIVATISLTLAILALVSLILGAVILYFYLLLLNSEYLFIHVLEEKILYPIACISFLIILIIVLYSSTPSFLYRENHKKETVKYSGYKNSQKELYKLYLLDVFIFQLFLFSIFITYNLNYENKNTETLINLLAFILILIFTTYFRYSYNELEKLTNSFSDVIFKYLILVLSIYISFIILIFGVNASELNNDVLYSIFFIFVPLLLSLLSSSIIFFFKKENYIFSITLFIIIIFLWFIPISQISPIIMNIIGINQKSCFFYEKDNKFTSLSWNIGEKYILTPHTEAIKNNDKIMLCERICLKKQYKHSFSINKTDLDIIK